MDVTGKVTDTYDYDAFGNVVGSTGPTSNVYRYQGEAWDAETGLYYLRARYYDPMTGRFLSVDPMTDQGEHPYTYAGADPVNGHDAAGQQEVLDYSMELAYFVPSPQVFIGMAANIKCLAGITLSTLAQASPLLQSVVACQVRSGGRGGSGTGGGGAGGGPKKGRVPKYVVVSSDLQYKANGRKRERDYKLYGDDDREWGPERTTSVYEDIQGVNGPAVGSTHGTTADEPEWTDRWIFRDGLSLEYAKPPVTEDQKFFVKYQGATYPLFVRDPYICGPQANGTNASPAHGPGDSPLARARIYRFRGSAYYVP